MSSNLALEELLDALYRKANVERCAPWLREIERKYPFQVELAKSLIESMDVETLLRFIASFSPRHREASQLPHARQWIADFKRMIEEER